ncbi:NAD-dependent deacylase [Myxococcus sp. K15C18031901]|uniref:SIR2 family NAD-dependent protein deacylase n=1 Tax=Myxococcus dinghuensis TaxID=2906761 RepID=UPI0020A7C09F|nr:Sir2 family NAD-dependent protein deacetylase [Myxococcus dinghuensis]MCP3103558.1 NAD-dependent deacylase [Myxococcus dinghuensis]
MPSVSPEARLEECRRRLHGGTWRDIVVLTGAGISVASGLPTYRGPGGLWTLPGTRAVPDAETFANAPSRLWSLFGPLRRQVEAARPNAAHVALADWERRLSPEARFTLLTQNVDGLHSRAGSRRVVELHGSLRHTRCGAPDCALEAYVDTTTPEHAPGCPRCESPLRPDVVLFGEPLPVDAEHTAKRALRDCDLFLAVGTSGQVTPAANFVRGAKYAGAWTVMVNLTPMEPRHPDFDTELLGRAEDVLPRLLAPDAA